MPKARDSARRQWSVAVSVTVFVLIGSVGAACGGDDESSAGSSPEGDLRIVQIPTSVSDFTQTVTVGAEEAAAEAGAELEVQIPAKADVSSQTSTLNGVIASRPDAVLLEPIDGEGMMPPVSQAKRAGIKVITYDSNLADPDLPDSFVANDYVEAGREIGRQLDELTGGDGELLFMAGLAGLPFSENLVKGFEAHVSGVSGLQALPIQYEEFEPARASSITAATVTSSPDLTGIYVGNQSVHRAATGVLRQRGLTGEISTVGFDGTPDGVRLLRSGALDVIISSPARDYGRVAVGFAIDAANGEEPPAEETLPYCVLTKENVDEPENEKCLYEKAEAN